MALILRGNGVVEGLTDLPAGSVTAADLASGAITSSALPAGSVLQVVSATKTDSASGSNTSFADITGLSVSITPSSTSSKILILSSLNVGTDKGNGGYIYARVARNGTALSLGDAAGSRTQATTTAGLVDGGNTLYKTIPTTINYLDSPSTTSSTTYSIQLAVPAGSESWTINRSHTDQDSAFQARTTSSITVMEVAG